MSLTYQEELFLHTLDDLRGRCAYRASEYDICQASGLIRRLFLDKNSLYHHACCRHKKSIPLATFSWAGTLQLNEGVDGTRHYWVGTRGMDPLFRELDHPLRESGIVTGGIDDLMRDHLVIEASDAPDPENPGPRATLKDVVQHYANKLGGVHYDPAAENEVLRDALTEFNGANLRQSLSAMGRVMVRGLDPLAMELLRLDDRAQMVRWMTARGAPPASVEQ